MYLESLQNAARYDRLWNKAMLNLAPIEIYCVGYGAIYSLCFFLFRWVLGVCKLCSLCCIRWYARRGVFKQKGVCQSKQMSVKTSCKTKPLLSLQFLVCNNCPIHPEQGYFSYFCTLQDLQRLTFPVFARPSEGLVWTVCPSAECIRAATYCQLSDKVKRFFWNSLPK